MECNNKKFTTVILDKGIDTPLDYFTSLPIQVGSRVLVPVKNSYRKGTVIQIKKKSLIKNIQPIKEILNYESLVYLFM